MSKLSTLTKLTELEEAYKAELAKVSNTIAEEIGLNFKSLCEKIPSIKKMGWSQFTPSFNDGDPCRFSANGVTIAFFEDIDNDDLAYEENEISEEGDIKRLYKMPSEEELINHDVCEYIKNKNEAILKHLSLEQRNTIREFFDMMMGLSEDLLEKAFDEGLVIYSADGSYEEESYEHD